MRLKIKLNKINYQKYFKSEIYLNVRDKTSYRFQMLFQTRISLKNISQKCIKHLRYLSLKLLDV